MKDFCKVREKEREGTSEGWSECGGERVSEGGSEGVSEGGRERVSE